MKTIQIFTAIILSLTLFSCGNSPKETAKASTVIDANISKIEVLDFHSTHRCMTCNAIEANTKYTLDTYFADELKTDQISFATINIDEPENEAITEKFEAYGTSLFLNVIHNGSETLIDLTDFAFAKGNEKEVFSNELKTRLEEELNKL
ncbi:MAG: nitrophenyl compound nitroreductase subunit ArsF family protein [Flavobacteriales bacterium]|jgi:hypothetical protein|nr:nitrophenyl compound nitroreductase subunit ArsF family protein [Flavobacteriales bacterium]